MSRIRHIFPALEASGNDVEYGQGDVDKHGKWWIENPEHVYGSFGDQDKGTQDTNDKVIVGQAIPYVSKSAFQKSFGWVTGDAQ